MIARAEKSKRQHIKEARDKITDLILSVAGCSRNSRTAGEIHESVDRLVSSHKRMEIPYFGLGKELRLICVVKKIKGKSVYSARAYFQEEYPEICVDSVECANDSIHISRIRKLEAIACSLENLRNFLDGQRKPIYGRLMTYYDGKGYVIEPVPN